MIILLLSCSVGILTCMTVALYLKLATAKHTLLMKQSDTNCESFQQGYNAGYKQGVSDGALKQYGYEPDSF